MLLALVGIHDVNRSVAAGEPVFYERKQHTILFLFGGQERTNMSVLGELGSRKRNGSCGPAHRDLPQLEAYRVGSWSLFPAPRKERRLKD